MVTAQYPSMPQMSYPPYYGMRPYYPYYPTYSANRWAYPAAANLTPPPQLQNAMPQQNAPGLDKMPPIGPPIDLKSVVQGGLLGTALGCLAGKGLDHIITILPQENSWIHRQLKHIDSLASNLNLKAERYFENSSSWRSIKNNAAVKDFLKQEEPLLEKSTLHPVGRTLAIGLSLLHKAIIGDVMGSQNEPVIHRTRFQRLWKPFSKPLKRVGAGFILLGAPLAEYASAPKETKRSKLADRFANNAGYLIGFEIGNRINPAALIQNAWLSNKLSGGIGRFIFSGLIVGSLFSSVFQKIAHCFFGDPEVLEKQLQASAGQKTPVGQAQQVPATPPPTQSKANRLVELSHSSIPETTTLTPDQIAFSPVAVKYDHDLRSELKRNANPWKTE
jgi:hypothetical protein